MTGTVPRAVKVLLVEDNLADVRLVQNILSGCRFPVQIRVAVDGEEALDVLRHSSIFKGREDPDLILLDLNLPKIDGQQVLAAVKGDQGLRHIPVLILTGSANEEDKALATRNHADDYLNKVTGPGDFDRLLERIDDFWSKRKEG